ncbi:MAG: hypothetical protein FVQ85_04975 [Planctomycetes bacterium]|nr:hypothetical protein [Planctomycetota bacterium]
MCSSLPRLKPDNCHNICTNERYPSGGYLDTTKIPKDGWDNDFIYELYPESGKPFVIISFGADGQEGSEGYDTDLLSTDP